MMTDAFVWIGRPDRHDRKFDAAPLDFEIERETKFFDEQLWDIWLDPEAYHDAKEWGGRVGLRHSGTVQEPWSLPVSLCYGFVFVFDDHRRAVEWMLKHGDGRA